MTPFACLSLGLFCAIYFGMSFTCFLLFLLFNFNFFALVCLKKKKKEVMLHEFAVSNCMNFMQYKDVFSYPVFMQFK